MGKILFALTIFTILFAPLNAQNPPKHAVNICAVAIPVMNLYVINYEYLYHERHGLTSRIEYNPMSGSGIDATGIAAVLNYRWHFIPKLESLFLGAYGRYRYSDGSGSADGTKFDFTVPEVNIGLNAGYRWIHDATGINIVIAAGYGYSWETEDISPSNDLITSKFNTFKKDNNTYFDAPFYGEFSIGYAF